jgi:hypothetical protein
MKCGILCSCLLQNISVQNNIEEQEGRSKLHKAQALWHVRPNVSKPERMRRNTSVEAGQGHPGCEGGEPVIGMTTLG